MAQNKEQLNKLLHFIKRLVDEPGNEDFVNDLRGMLAIPIHASGDSMKLLDIEKYLGLDYKLDHAIPDIDYSFIKEGVVKEQLVSDYREMLRYRYGVRSHKIDFSEFCRYAMLQVEQLLNYFYQNKFISNDEMLNYIKNNASWFKREEIDSVKSLSLSAKLSAFSVNLEKKQHDCLDFAREVRNEQSHRNSNEEINGTNEFRAKLLSLGLPLTREGEVYWNGIKDNAELLLRYKSIEKYEYWRYRYLLWRQREPFNEIAEAIKAVSLQVEIQLQEKREQ